MIWGFVVVIVGYAMLLACKRPAVQYDGAFLAASGVWGWLSNNLAPHYVRATGVGFRIAIANCAAFVATFTYLSKDA